MTDAIRHVLAVKTYGSTRKMRNGKRISALKIGYTGSIAAILLQLLPNTRDISSKRDSYTYIYVPNKPRLHRNWLFIELTDDELQQAEQITRRHDHNRGVVLWKDSSWQYLPCELTPDYHAPSYGADIPKGSPAGYWHINTQGETGASGGSSDPDTLIAEYSKLHPQKAAWWWIPGNDATYRHRVALKRAGCRWNRRRRAYAYVGDRLPESLLQLLDNAEECRAIMGGMESDTAKRRYRYEDTGDSPDSDQEITGESEISMPPTTNDSVSNTINEESAVCDCTTTAGPAGWLPADTDSTWQACASCNPSGSQMPQTDASDPDIVVPAVRIIRAPRLTNSEADDDSIQSAIRRTAPVDSDPLPAARGTGRGDLMRLPMDYAGQLTGSVTADVFCYGYATDTGTLIYLNMGGPRSGVEAIRGKLSKAHPVNLVPDDAPAMELTPGEEQTGKYTAILHNLSEARFMHCILVHEDLVEPAYGSKATTYIIQVDAEQARGQLLHHVRETVGLPVFDGWCDYLWRAGQTAMLVRNCRTGGGITVKAVTLDREAWTRLITGGVAEGLIAIPEPETLTI